MVAGNRPIDTDLQETFCRRFPGIESGARDASISGVGAQAFGLIDSQNLCVLCKSHNTLTLIIKVCNILS